MKKRKLKKFLVGATMGLCVMAMPFGMVGCDKGDDGDKDFEPYISVTGIDTEFVLNEELNLSNAVLKYFEDKDSVKTERITEEMIAWEGTDVAGEYTMEIIFNGESQTINYVVYDINSIIQLVKTTTNLQSEIQISRIVDGTGLDYGIYKPNSTYYFDNTDGGDDATETIRQHWYVVEDDEKCEYSYHIESGVPTRKDKYILDNEEEIGIASVASLLESYSEYTKFLIKNADDTFTLKFVEEYEDSYGKRIYSDEFIIKNGLIISDKISTTYINNSNETEYYETESEYTYENVLEVPSIPQNVDWEISSD